MLNLNWYALTSLEWSNMTRGQWSTETVGPSSDIIEQILAWCSLTDKEWEDMSKTQWVELLACLPSSIQADMVGKITSVHNPKWTKYNKAYVPAVTRFPTLNAEPAPAIAIRLPVFVSVNKEISIFSAPFNNGYVPVATKIPKTVFNPPVLPMPEQIRLIGNVVQKYIKPPKWTKYERAYVPAITKFSLSINSDPVLTKIKLPNLVSVNKIISTFSTPLFIYSNIVDQVLAWCSLTEEEWVEMSQIQWAEFLVCMPIITKASLVGEVKSKYNPKWTKHENAYIPAATRYPKKTEEPKPEQNITQAETTMFNFSENEILKKVRMPTPVLVNQTPKNKSMLAKKNNGYVPAITKL